jgi:hypothetical protein
MSPAIRAMPIQRKALPGMATNARVAIEIDRAVHLRTARLEIATTNVAPVATRTAKNTANTEIDVQVPAPREEAVVGTTAMLEDRADLAVVVEK